MAMTEALNETTTNVSGTEANNEKGQNFWLHMTGLLLQAHPDHTCRLTDIQCILQYIALAQDVSVLTLGLQSQQALCR